MARDDGYRRYLEAAAVLGQITKARAEQIVREMVSGGEVQRAQAQEWVDELIERGRKATGDLVEVVRTEVSNQLHSLGLDPDDLARQAADILRRSAQAGRRVVRDAAGQAQGGARGAKKTPAAPKAAAPTREVGTTPAKKAPVKKAPAKKAAAPQAAKASVTKKASTKKASAKKAPAKKAPAKSATAKKSGASASTKKAH